MVTVKSIWCALELYFDPDQFCRVIRFSMSASKKAEQSKAEKELLQTEIEEVGTKVQWLKLLIIRFLFSVGPLTY